MKLIVNKKYTLPSWPPEYFIIVNKVSEDLEWLYYTDNRGIESKTNLTLPWEPYNE